MDPGRDRLAATLRQRGFRGEGDAHRPALLAVPLIFLAFVARLRGFPGCEHEQVVDLEDVPEPDGVASAPAAVEVPRAPPSDPTATYFPSCRPLTSDGAGDR